MKNLVFCSLWARPHGTNSPLSPTITNPRFLQVQPQNIFSHTSKPPHFSPDSPVFLLRVCVHFMLLFLVCYYINICLHVYL